MEKLDYKKFEINLSSFLYTPAGKINREDQYIWTANSTEFTNCNFQAYDKNLDVQCVIRCPIDSTSLLQSTILKA